MSLTTIFLEIAEERIRQDHKWGGPAKDDKNDPRLWKEIIKGYLSWAGVMMSMGSMHKARHRLLQTAALVVAWVESIDRSQKRPVETTGLSIAPAQGGVSLGQVISGNTELTGHVIVAVSHGTDPCPDCPSDCERCGEPMARLSELEVTEKLLADRQRVLDAIPECPLHGSCVPNALEWIEQARENWNRANDLEATNRELLAMLEGARNYVTEPALRARIHAVVPPIRTED